jgi:hypothetical protein
MGRRALRVLFKKNLIDTAIVESGQPMPDSIESLF